MAAFGRKNAEAEMPYREELAQSLEGRIRGGSFRNAANGDSLTFLVRRRSRFQAGGPRGRAPLYQLSILRVTEI
jgi:hypothetical protein